MLLLSFRACVAMEPFVWWALKLWRHVWTTVLCKAMRFDFVGVLLLMSSLVIDSEGIMGVHMHWRHFAVAAFSASVGNCAPFLGMEYGHQQHHKALYNITLHQKTPHLTTTTPSQYCITSSTMTHHHTLPHNTQLRHTAACNTTRH